MPSLTPEAKCLPEGVTFPQVFLDVSRSYAQFCRTELTGSICVIAGLIARGLKVVLILCSHRRSRYHIYSRPMSKRLVLRI